MSITLPPDIEEFVSQELEHGTYASADELLRDAVQLLRSRHQQAGELKKLIDDGVAQLDRGEYSDYDETTLRERFEELHEIIRRQTATARK
jgi:antitoxin ParD1/3/4